MNRATQGVTLFKSTEEYLTFKLTLEQGVAKVPDVRLLAYCIMPNHFHLLTWPTSGDVLSAFMRWVTATHAQRWRDAQGNRGRGAVYQGRFRAVAVHDEPSVLRTGRYVERNPVRGGFVDRCDEWPWSSAANDGRRRIALARWPVPRPSDWARHVNLEEPQADLDEIRTCIAIGRAIGPEANMLTGTEPIDSPARGNFSATDLEREEHPNAAR